MNSDSKRLLNEIFDDAAPAGFRAAVLDQTLRQVRHRRRMRSVNRGAILAAVLFGASALLVRNARHSPSPITARISTQKPPTLLVVHSRPLPPAMTVESQPGHVQVVSSSSRDVAMIETGSDRGLYRELTDDELLLLLGDRPAALVRQGPHQAELVFVNPSDEKGFPVP